MNKKRRVLAIVGTYRKGGIIDSAVDEILGSAQEAGAEVEKIYLIDKHIEFCNNCRTCTQVDGVERGGCVIKDDMKSILETTDLADALVLASPMNFGTVTAVTKKFIERLVCFSYWPWGANAPKVRDKTRVKVAVLVVSSAAPSWLARLSSTMAKLMKSVVGLLGARTIGVLFIGLAAGQVNQKLGECNIKKARRLGARLARAI